MRSITPLYCYLLLCCLGLLACNNDIQEAALSPFVNPPVPALNPEFATFSFQAEEGFQQTMGNGSEIHIPAHALVDEEGQPVKGRVDLRYRELHDAVSIYLAGVPMTYEKDSSATPFATAGTFELRVDQNGQPLNMQAGKMADVKMASFESGDDYQFYFLDEQGREWDSLGSVAPEINQSKRKLAKKIRRMKPALAFPLNRRYMALNYNIIADVFYDQSDLAKVDHAYFKKRLKGYGLGWNNVDTYNSIVFKGQKIPASLMVWKNSKGKVFPEWTAGRHGKFTLIKGTRYQLDITGKDSSQTFSCQLQAIMPLKSLLAFEPDYWKNNYKEAMAQVRQEEERMQLMAEVFRSYKVAEFGIYNWDKLIKEEEAISLNADFKFDRSFNDQLTQPEIVYLSGDGKSVIRYPQSAWKLFSLLPDDKARMFSILPGNKVAVFSKEDFADINYEQLRNSPDPSYMFRMKGEEQSLNSEEDFRALLGI